MERSCTEKEKKYAHTQCSAGTQWEFLVYYPNFYAQSVFLSHLSLPKALGIKNMF